MNQIITLLCLLLIVFTTEVKAGSAPVQINGSPIFLKDQAGVSGPLIASEVLVTYTPYSVLRNPILWARGDNTLIVQLGRDTYSFHIPKASIGTNGEFNVDRDSTTQAVRISSKINKSAEIKTISKKVIACESPVYSHIEFPAPANQRFTIPKMIEVEVETTSWQQQSNYFIISSAVDYTVLKEQPELKSQDKIIGSLAECFR